MLLQRDLDRGPVPIPSSCSDIIDDATEVTNATEVTWLQNATTASPSSGPLDAYDTIGMLLRRDLDRGLVPIQFAFPILPQYSAGKTNMSLQPFDNILIAWRSPGIASRDSQDKLEMHISTSRSHLIDIPSRDFECDTVEIDKRGGLLEELNIFFAFQRLVDLPPIDRRRARLLRLRAQRPRTRYRHTDAHLLRLPLRPVRPTRLWSRHNMTEQIGHRRLCRVERLRQRAMRRAMVRGILWRVHQPTHDIHPPARSSLRRLIVAAWSPLITLHLHAIWVVAMCDAAACATVSLAVTVLATYFRHATDALCRMPIEPVLEDAAHRIWSLDSAKKRTRSSATRPRRRHTNLTSWQRLNCARRAVTTSTRDDILLALAVSRLALAAAELGAHGAMARLVASHRDRAESRIETHAFLLAKREANATAGQFACFLWQWTRVHGMILTKVLTSPSLAICTALAMLTTVGAGDPDYSSSSRPPMFDGTRAGFLVWYMAFTGFVAWKLTECVDILDGTEVEPVVPPPGPLNAGVPNNQGRHRRRHRGPQRLAQTQPQAVRPPYPSRT